MEEIPLSYLKSLLVVAGSNSLREAAQVLGITQPGLTKQLQALESQLPFAVFAEEGKKKKLTPFGRELVNQLRDKIGGVGSVVRQTCERFKDPAQSTIRLAGRVGVFDQFASRLNYPGRVLFLDVPHHEIIRAVLEQRADIGITFHSEDRLDLIAKKLYAESFKLILPKKDFAKPTGPLGDLFRKLSSFPCVAYKEKDDVVQEIVSCFGVKSSDLDIRRAVPNFHIMVSMVEKGHGWSIVPRHFPVDSDRVWVTDIPPQHHSMRQFYLYYRPELAGTPWLKLLRQQIETCFS